MKNFEKMLGFITSTDNSFRDTAMNDTVGVFVVDTVLTPDTEKWETGVSKNDKGWVVVQQYDTEDDAKKGHIKWMKAVKNPNIVLEECSDIKDFYGL